MKKRYGVLVAILGMTLAVNSQDFKLAKSTGRLEIKEVNNVAVEGYEGSEIIFSSLSHNREQDNRAKGLKAISGLGLEDNTGLGLSVVEKGNVYEVQQLKKMDGPKIKIMIPKGVIVSYTHTSPYGDAVSFKNVSGEIEVSTVHNDILLENVTGPMTINTAHGDVDVNFVANIANPISIVSTHGHVDVALPLTTKANLKLNTVYGSIYVDPDFKIEMDKAGNMVKYSDKLSGKLNGGGIDMSFTSSHDNVYLRKK